MEADEKQIVRQNDRSLWKKDGSNLNTTHIYPYHALPELKSHIHPQFAIFDAGKKLAKLTELSDEKLEFLKVINDYPDRSSSIAKIQTLYGVWIRPPPKNAAKDISYVDPNEELAFEHEVSSIDDSNSKDSNYKGHGIRTNRTKSGRGDGLHLRPKTRSVAAAEQDDRSGRPRTRSVAAKRDGNGSGHPAKSGRMADKRKAAVRKRKVLYGSSAHNQLLLSEATLSRFNRRFGGGAWTGDHIRQWLKTLPMKRRLVSSLSIDLCLSSY
jgi:hypothetical protein